MRPFVFDESSVLCGAICHSWHQKILGEVRKNFDETDARQHCTQIGTLRRLK